MAALLSPRTVSILILIGLITIFFVLATLFTSLTEKSLNITSISSVKLGTADFRNAIESITGSTARPVDSDIEIFNDGSLFLADLIKEINSAKHSVTITNYIFYKGEMTNTLFDALSAKAKEGISVRLLMDAHGSSKAPDDKIKEMKDAGVKVEMFRPTNIRTLTRIYRRSHVRAIAIDGKVGYIGGVAFQDEWAGDGTSGKMWRDLMFKFHSSLAQATQDQFNGLWRSTTGEILNGKDFYPTLESIPLENPGPYFVSLLHTPAPDVSADLLDIIWLTINGAQDHIYLATAYLTPPREILEALEVAVKRGVTVELAVPGPNTDSKIIQSATRSYYEKLLGAGVHIYEYQPGRFHEKFITADGHWSLIGSANMDNRSAALNVENVFGIENQKLAQNLEKEFQFNKDNSKEILKEDWHPNIFKRVYYLTTTLFVKQF